ncbi:hypothetical protein MFLO_08932 [Listeria floridensis FSL S10-1187]|uniref:Crp/Fnr family transcriptional regulator n=1 Tax=Listeria floridensis FSL S10-1187 TaxID=1265817 RepID=A0ABN0REL1_9LIST|nr:hypothetical protein [Listeria floridensis]EUJ31337.1 hypothetical protein MFLO_08932 [Listeria floridensis FSL S10-1187]
MEGHREKINTMSWGIIIEELRLNQYQKGLVKTVSYEEGERIPENMQQHIGIVKSGSVFSFFSDHNSNVVNFCLSNNLIGLSNLFPDDRLEVKPLMHLALSKVEITLINQEYMLNYFSIRPAFMEYLIKCINSFYKSNIENYICLQDDVHERVYQVIEKLLPTHYYDGTEKAKKSINILNFLLDLCQVRYQERPALVGYFVRFGILHMEGDSVIFDFQAIKYSKLRIT